MSYDLCMDTFNLKATPRLAHTEYCSNENLIRHVTGMTDDCPERTAAFYKAWNYDFIWSTNNGPEPWEDRGRVTDMGHSEFLEGGVDLRQPQTCPFSTVEEAWAFDAVQEYGYTDWDKLVSYYESTYQEARRRYPEQVFTGGYYRTLFSGAIAIFGWDMLLMAASDLKQFAKVMDSIFQQSLHHYRAWAESTAEVIMCHDDMVWTSGPFMRPDFYRSEVFPRYKELWKIIKDSGKKLAFTSDGDWSMFVDDIVEAGADILVFEPIMDMKPVVEKYGQSHCLVASYVDARTLTFGNKAQIQAEIDATLELAPQCKGLMFAVGNHIPSNVPVENALFYYDYLKSHWQR